MVGGSGNLDGTEWCGDGTKKRQIVLGKEWIWWPPNPNTFLVVDLAGSGPEGP